MKKFFSLIAAVLFAGSMMATTVTKTVEELATANSWENGVVVTPFALDEVISVSTEATDANTGKYYTSGQQIRLYQTGAAKLIISAADGYTISSITLEYASQNGGIFAEAASGTAVDFENVQSATFTVANSGEATNGQARVTSISVTYDAGGVVPPTPAAIEVNMSEGLRYEDYVATDGWWQIFGSDEHYAVSVSNVSTTQAEGTNTIADLDADYTYLAIFNGTDTTEISFVDGSVTLSIDAQTGNVTVAGTLVGNDGKSYNLNLQFIVPTPQETVNVNIQNAQLVDYYAGYGLYGVYGTDANGVYVQLAIWAEQGFQGQFTEEDFDMKYIGSGLMIGDEQVDIYSAAITVTPGNGGDYTITATLLCYNNKQYNVTMYVPATQGIEGVDAAVKAIKSIVNGQVVIEKNNKFYNINGAVIR